MGRGQVEFRVRDRSGVGPLNIFGTLNINHSKNLDCVPAELCKVI